MPFIMKPNASRYLIEIARISPLWFRTQAAGGLCVAFRGCVGFLHPWCPKWSAAQDLEHPHGPLALSTLNNWVMDGDSLAPGGLRPCHAAFCSRRRRPLVLQLGLGLGVARFEEFDSFGLAALAGDSAKVCPLAREEAGVNPKRIKRAESDKEAASTT